MRLVPIDDPNDSRVDEYRHLTDVELRVSKESSDGSFMAEGLLVLERVLAAGMSVRSVLTGPKWVDRLRTLTGLSDVQVFAASDEIVSTVAGFRVHRGCLAVVDRPRTISLADVTTRPGHLLVLGDLVDHGNVGLAFRSAAALGIAGVVISPRCADPLYRRALRTSMGAVLALPWARSQDWLADLTRMRASGVRLIGLTPSSPRDIRDAVRGWDRVGLVLGPEGPGLDPASARACDDMASIPMAEAVDSLNVAAAAAVACYALHVFGSSSTSGA